MRSMTRRWNFPGPITPLSPRRSPGRTAATLLRCTSRPMSLWASPLTPRSTSQGASRFPCSPCCRDVGPPAPGAAEGCNAPAAVSAKLLWNTSEASGRRGQAKGSVTFPPSSSLAMIQSHPAPVEALVVSATPQNLLPDPVPLHKNLLNMTIGRQGPGMLGEQYRWRWMRKIDRRRGDCPTAVDGRFLPG